MSRDRAEKIAHEVCCENGYDLSASPKSREVMDLVDVQRLLADAIELLIAIADAGGCVCHKMSECDSCEAMGSLDAYLESHEEESDE